MKLQSFLMISFLTVFLISCSKEPKPIEFGLDDCDHCKMNISDNRYGAELVTKKGRVYKFDDLYCMKVFLQDELVAKDQVLSLWIIDFEGTEKLLPADKSFLLHNPELKSPMGSNIAAFADEIVLKENQSKHSGTILSWKDYFNSK